MSYRRLLLLAVSSLIVALLLPAEVEAKKEKKSKKRMVITGDLVVDFVPGQDLILAWTGRDEVLLLNYPDLEIASQLTVGGNEKVREMRLSEDRKWLATRYKSGPLQVWSLEQGKPVLTLSEQVSDGFVFHPREDRLFAFQPKIGITQWDLATGAQVGPTLTEATVFLDRIWVSPSGNHLLTEGTCKVPSGTYDYCLFDLRDGSVVAWAPDNSPWAQAGRGGATEEDIALARELAELAEAVGFEFMGSAGEEVAPGCERMEDGKLLCRSVQTCALVDPSLEEQSSERSGSTARKAMNLFGVPSPEEMRADFPGRSLWQIRASQERKRLIIDSCDLSADGQWVVVGVNGLSVEVYTTRELEPKSLRLMGSWDQPRLVASIELP